MIYHHNYNMPPDFHLVFHDEFVVLVYSVEIVSNVE